MNHQKTNTLSPLEDEGERLSPTLKPEPAARMPRKSVLAGKPRQPTKAPKLEEVAKVLRYDPDTGNLHRVVLKGGRKPGSIAGRICAQGYVVTGFQNKLYKAHRLAWLLHYGVNPTNQIDHINLDKTDNRIANLREVLPHENTHNQKVRITSKSGVKGVCKSPRSRGWTAAILCRGERHHLGTFDTKEAASAAYDEASRRLHGEFGRQNDGEAEIRF